MRRRAIEYLAAGCMLVWPVLLRAQGIAAGECCASALDPLSARTVAVGQAVTARPDDDAIFGNPAGLAKRNSQLLLHRTALGEDPMTTMTISYRSRIAGTFALTYRFIDYGTSEGRDKNGSPTPDLTLADQALTASYGTNIGAGLNAGLSFTLHFENYACNTESCGGTTQMLAGGLTYAPPLLRHVTIGAALLNLGSKLQIENAAQADPTPVRGRVGVAYEIGHLLTRDTMVSVWLQVDAVERFNDPTAVGINAGVEVSLGGVMFLRAGHASEADGVSHGTDAVGLGMHYQRFEVGVAKSMTRSPLFDQPAYVTFGLKL